MLNDYNAKSDYRTMGYNEPGMNAMETPKLSPITMDIRSNNNIQQAVEETAVLINALEEAIHIHSSRIDMILEQVPEDNSKLAASNPCSTALESLIRERNTRIRQLTAYVRNMTARVAL